MKNLTIVLGANIRRVTESMAERIRADAERLRNEKSDNKVFLVVPDQYTMTAERVYIDMLGEELMSYVRVLSFKRLASLAINAVGTERRLLDKSGKSALLLQAYRNKEKELAFYKDCGSVHFTEALCSQMTELKTAHIQPEQLRATGREKLCDLAALCDEYNRLLGVSFADPDDRMEMFARAAEASGLFNGTRVYFDFFKVFNASETKAIVAVLSAGADVTVSLKLTDASSGEAVLKPVVAVYNRLVREANEVGCEVKAEHIADAYSENDVMRNMEKNLFFAGQTVGISNDCVRFYKGAGRTDEVDFIAAEIARLVREEGYRYGDFAVVTRDTGVYEAALDTVFGEYGIPLFLHRKTPLRKKLPVRILTDVLDSVSDKYAADSLCDLVKTGLCRFTPEEASAFEQYVYTWNLQYLSSFEKPFDRSMDGFRVAEEDSEDDKKLLALAESARVRVLNCIAPFRGGKNTVREFCTRAYALLKECDLAETLEGLGKAYELYGEHVLFRENMQVLQLMTDTLDELVAVSGDCVVSVTEFRSLLLAVADSADIGIIPTSADAVLVGDADVVPLYAQKIVFVCGLAEGEFPAVGSAGGLMNRRDREELEKSGVDTGLSEEDRYLYELFFTRFVLTTARERVVLTYPAVTTSEKKPSQAFAQTLSGFEDAKPESAPTSVCPEKFEQRVQRERPSFALSARQPITELTEYYRESKYAEYMKEPVFCDSLLPGTAEKLFGTSMALSATKVDTYHRCRYHYFYQYGLKLFKKQQVRFDPKNAGTFIHKILENVMSAPEWMQEDDEALLIRVKNNAHVFFNAVFIEAPSVTFTVYLDNLIQKIFRLLKKYREDLLKTKFVPIRFEQRIAPDSDLKPVVIHTKDGRCTVYMNGTIDRIDAFEKDGVQYVRVMDYKTGSKKFSLSEISNGIDIQLIMYLLALKENGQNILGGSNPVGAVYVSAKQNIVNELAKAEPDYSGIYQSGDAVAEAGIVAQKNISIEDEETFDIMYRHIRTLLAKMGGELLKGRILRSSCDENDCKYCDIKSVCTQYAKGRKKEKLKKKEDILEKMKTEAETNE